MANATVRADGHCSDLQRVTPGAYRQVRLLDLGAALRQAHPPAGTLRPQLELAELDRILCLPPPSSDREY